jgi:hypothetical protein
MKNWVCLSLAFLFIQSFNYSVKAGNNDQADAVDDNYRSIIKLEFYLGGIQYEYRTGYRSTLNLSMQLNGIFNLDKHDLQITPEYKYYFSSWKGSPYGLYVGSYLFYRDYNISKNILSEGFMVYSRDLVKTGGVGLKLGFQTLVLDQFSFDFGIGLGYNVFRDVKTAFGVGIVNESTLNTSVTGGVTVGYAF